MITSLFSTRLLKNGHLLRFPHPSSLRRTAKYVSLLGISGALHLAFFEQPETDETFDLFLLGRSNQNIPPPFMTLSAVEVSKDDQSKADGSNRTRHKKDGATGSRDCQTPIV
jgi:hypothetical protein